MSHAEDSHSGLDARYNGYRLTYLPVPRAAGICPASLDAFMRQRCNLAVAGRLIVPGRSAA